MLDQAHPIIAAKTDDTPELDINLPLENTVLGRTANSRTGENSLSTLQHAEAYAGLGFSVVPIHRVNNGKCSCQSPKCKSPGKHPVTRLVPHGFKEASADVGKLHEWFGEHDYNIGIATGKQSGIVVVDVDGQAGLDSLETLKVQGISFETAYVTTGRGKHYYFRYPMGDIHIPSSSGQLAPGIDIRAEGGMVVAPPSLHASGTRRLP